MNELTDPDVLKRQITIDDYTVQMRYWKSEEKFIVMLIKNSNQNFIHFGYTTHPELNWKAAVNWAKRESYTSRYIYKL